MLALNRVKKKKLLRSKKILGVILARGNSKGIKNKNLLKIHKKTLVEIAIDNAKKSKKLTRLFFSSDSDKLIKLAKKKMNVPYKRPKKLATSKSSTYEVLKHAVNWLEINEKWKADIILALPPTTPFRSSKHIDKIIDLMIKSRSNSAITVTEPSYPPFWMIRKDKKNFKFLLPEGKKIQRRQDAPKVYQPAGMVYALSYNFLFKMKGILPQKKTIGLLVKKEMSINIDSKFDYEMAKFYAKKIK